MEILPYKNVTLKTELEAEEVINRIEDSIENVGFQFFRYGIFSDVYEKPFEGGINDNEFEIKRLVTYRNVMLPIIFGNIIRESNITKIEIKMRPRIVASIAINVFAIIGIIINLSIFRKANFELNDFFPAIIFLLLPIVFYASFWYECKTAIEELENLIESKKNEC
jgi:hypothetical protein